jgi:hypothetical protein
MSDVKPIAPVRIGQTDIFYAQGVRAGSWLFLIEDQNSASLPSPAGGATARAGEFAVTAVGPGRRPGAFPDWPVSLTRIPTAA